MVKRPQGPNLRADAVVALTWQVVASVVPVMKWQCAPVIVEMEMEKEGEEEEEVVAM